MIKLDNKQRPDVIDFYNLLLDYDKENVLFEYLQKIQKNDVSFLKIP